MNASKIKVFIIFSLVTLSKHKSEVSAISPPTLAVTVTPRHIQIPVNEMINHPVADVRVRQDSNAKIDFSIEATQTVLHGLNFKDGSKYFTLHQRGPNALKLYLTKSLQDEFKPGDKLTLSLVAIPEGGVATRQELFIEVEDPHEGFLGPPLPSNLPTNLSPVNSSTAVPKSVNKKTNSTIVAMSAEEAKKMKEKMAEKAKNDKDNKQSDGSSVYVAVLFPMFFFPAIGFVGWRKRHEIKKRLNNLCCKETKDTDIEKEDVKNNTGHSDFVHEMQITSADNPRKISTSSNNSNLYTSNPAGLEADTKPIMNDEEWEFPRHQLKIVGKIGEGCFGQVWKYEAENIAGREGLTTVAVKTLRNTATDKEKSDLLHELAVMKLLDPHPNVVRLLGCCTEKDPIYIILEFVHGGTLQDFLRKSRSHHNYRNLHGDSQNLTARDLTSFALQVAKGMAYLSSKKVIHRDLAARNILLEEEDLVCKVADFGFARDVMANNIYERKSEGRLPIRWMAPESLYDNCYTTKSDVWSFGVLMWEIVALGATPYPGKSASEVMKFVRDSGRLEKPPHCDRQLYNIMSYCWSADPEDRPSFEELVSEFEKLLVEDTDYIDLNMYPEHAYYNEVGLSDERV